MNRFFNEGNKKLGFGCMRLPMDGEKVDYTEFSKMIDIFIENGFNYFDTARGYLKGKSETSLRDCLTSRYPRDAYILTNKLSNNYFEKQEEIRPLFESQLEACGVEYFDLYLMHAQNAKIYAKYKKLNAYETALDLKKEGRIKHFGISFHDKADVLDQILTEYPQIEVVQIQFNYIDYEDPVIEGRKCYEVCEKHGKPVIVMEPVNGGKLVNLSDTANKIFEDLHGGSSASYAIRFAADFPNVVMVLSGMGNMDMITENIGFMKDFVPLSIAEKEAIQQVCEIFRSQDLIPCTECCYCLEQCPKNIAIPKLFACLNAKKHFQNWNADYYYNNVYTKDGIKASDCIRCGKCEQICPQHLEIRKLLTDVANVFDK